MTTEPAPETITWESDLQQRTKWWPAAKKIPTCGHGTITYAEWCILLRDEAMSTIGPIRWAGNVIRRRLGAGRDCRAQVSVWGVMGRRRRA